MVIQSERAKDRAYEGFAHLAAALAHPYRIRILELLAQGERTVEEVHAYTPLGRKNASAQLRVLRNAGLVEGRQDGRNVRYRLADPRVVRLMRALQSDAWERDPAYGRLARDFYETEPALAPLGLKELKQRLSRGDVFILDVRPAEEYAAGHVPGAVSIPIESLESTLAELPRDREILVYCRGPYCVWEVDAVRLLRSRGFEARRTGVGVADWASDGHPLTQEEAA